MGFDFAILDAIQDTMRCDLLDFLFPKITMLGNAGLLWIAAALTLLCIRKYRFHGIQLAAGLLAGLIIGNLLLKNIVLRERPCWINEDVAMLIAIPRDYSFPSGHSMSSFCAAYILCRCSWRMGVPAYILAVLIAFSRLYLYVHFPTDVLAGILIGTGIGVVTVMLTKKYLRLPVQTE